MSTKRRITQGIGANGLGQIVTLLTQVASVPILIHAWGVELYGEWITLSAIPTYLVLSDVGFTSIAGNSLALMAENNDARKMQGIYQSTWVMVSILSSTVLVVAAAAMWSTNLGKAIGLSHITSDTLNLTLFILFLHVALSMQTGILQLPFQALKKNPMAVAAINLIRLLEWLVATIVILMGGTIVKFAMAFLVVRILGNFGLWLAISRSGSSLKLGIHHASLQTIKTLLRPSFASLCFPLGLSFTMQGFILLISSVIGPSAVALFSIYRTFTRIPIQLATMLNQAVWPELSYAFGNNDLNKAKNLVIKMLQFGAALSVFTAFAVYFQGETAINLWTSNSLEYNPQLLIALTLTALIHILWQPFWVAQIAINRHARFALSFLIFSTLSLVLGWILMINFNLQGAGYAILLTECLIAVFAFLTFARYFKAV